MNGGIEPQATPPSAGAELLNLQLRVPAAASGQRLDQYLATVWPQFSRSQLQQWIKGAQLTVSGQAVKTSQRIWGGEEVILRAELERHDEFQAEDIPLQLLYEDEDVLVVNKPAGMVVHPAAGNWQGTLVNALLHYDTQLERLPRAGIVHRLDKDTSGALLVARHGEARQRLVAAMQQRLIKRHYVALVWGKAVLQTTVDAAIGRHPRERTRMAVTHSGKAARTHLFREQQWQHAARLRAELESGRTHQIRVHCAHIGLPLVGDPTYGRRHLPKSLAPELAEQIVAFPRQALHAYHLAFQQPMGEEWVSLTSPLPDDLRALITAFEKYDGGRP